MDTLDDAIHELITAHLKRARISGRRFGLDALGDPGFVSSLKRGRGMSLKTADKVLTEMGEPPIGPAFQREVEAFIEADGGRATAFGEQSAGDLSFVHRLQDGVSLHLATVDRVRDWMASEADEAGLAAMRRAVAGVPLLARRRARRKETGSEEDEGPHLSTTEAAAWLGISARSLYRLRKEKRGPDHYIFGCRILYRMGALERWAAERFVRSARGCGKRSGCKWCLRHGKKAVDTVLCLVAVPVGLDLVVVDPAMAAGRSAISGALDTAADMVAGGGGHLAGVLAAGTVLMCRVLSVLRSGAMQVPGTTVEPGAAGRERGAGRPRRRFVRMGWREAPAGSGRALRGVRLRIARGRVGATAARKGLALARPSLLALPALLLCGCGLTLVEDAREEARTVASEATAARTAPPEAGYITVRRVDRPWVGLERIEQDRTALPGRLLGKDAVTLPLTGADDDAVLAARIEAAAGIPVRFAGAARADAGASFAVTDLLVPNGAVWTGPLDRLLDAWTETAGYEWRYRGTPRPKETSGYRETPRHDGGAGRIEIVRSLAAVFRVNALAGSERHGASSSTQDRAGEDGSASLSAQSIESETVYDPWPEIEEQIAGLVGEETVVTVSPASASVTVSGAPADVRKVRGYLGWLNREVLRPVTLSVHLYAVRFERESDHGVDLSLSETLGSSVGLSVAGDTVSLIRPSGAEDTLAAAVRALSRAGTVSRVLSADIPSLNGKPAQFLELTNEAYLKELRTTAGEGVAQTELVPGTVSSGFALSYLARITGPDEVLVRLSASLRDRPRFTTFTTDGHTIQLPAYGGRAVQVTRRIGRGETLMVTGFSDRGAVSSREGSVDADIPLPTGGRSARLVREERVLLIAADIGAPLGISEVQGVELDRGVPLYQGVPLYRGDPPDQGVPL